MKIEYNTNKSAELLIIFKDEDIVRYSFEKRRRQDKEPVYNKMRVNSVAEQSTRYCNYSKEKFGGEVTFVIPSWANIKERSYTISQFNDETYYADYIPEFSLINSYLGAEQYYLELIEEGWKPQQAREVLPLATATEVVYTAFEDDWEHFFRLRSLESTGKVHPNAKQVADMALKLLDSKNILKRENL